MELTGAIGKLRLRIASQLSNIYPQQDVGSIADRLLAAMGLEKSLNDAPAAEQYWDEQSIAVITYGNTFAEQDEKPLKSLFGFLHKYLRELIDIVHILPFFPSSSDDGFAVTDYTGVNEELGDWDDVERISAEYRTMSDLVINHCSSRNPWFEQFKRGQAPGRDYFIEADPGEDLSMVVRPRTSPLLSRVETVNGIRHVWCTFSHDQVDLDFRNPEVLVEFVRIIRLYLNRGIQIFRLDAVAFLWKQAGTDCLNLEQTHEIVRLLRTLIEHHTPAAVIITETNIPNRQNLTYFGNGNEAHLIYNFSLPPLLVYSLISGNCKYLKTWMMSMPPARFGTTYFNFIASHDGIGLRPIEGHLSDEETQGFIDTMQAFGGMVSWRALGGGQKKPYEVNIALYDALKGTIENGADDMAEKRFICAHAIMLALEGIPAFYIHSLLATRNDYQRMQQTGNPRAINRQRWNLGEIDRLLQQDSHHGRIFGELARLIRIRRTQKAFHPNATQFTMHFGNAIFAFWRQSIDRDQSIFCLNNVSPTVQEINLADINLIVDEDWYDLISATTYPDLYAGISLQPYQSIWLTDR